jgi:hypothetical protein
MCLFDNKSIYHSKVAVTERFICLCVRVLNLYALKSKYFVEKINKRGQPSIPTAYNYLTYC